MCSYYFKQQTKINVPFQMFYKKISCSLHNTIPLKQVVSNVFSYSDVSKN